VIIIRCNTGFPKGTKSLVGTPAWTVAALPQSSSLHAPLQKRPFSSKPSQSANWHTSVC